MSTDSLTSKFAAFRATTTITAPGAPEARATVRRQRRRSVILTVVAVLALLGGISTVFTGQPDRLTVATPPDGWQQTIRNASMDLGGHNTARCAGPTVQFTDGTATVRYQGFDWTYTIADADLVSADINRDGRPDYIVPIGCKQIVAAEPCPHSPERCARNEALVPQYFGQFFVLTGDPDHLTAIDGLYVFTKRRDQPISTHLTVTGDGLITITDDGRTLKVRYRDGAFVTVSG